MDARIDSFNQDERKAALADFRKTFQGIPETTDHNMHCHTFFSFNGYGYSPSHIACHAKQNGWFAAGTVDFDVLDAVDEFIRAASLLALRASCGMESRVMVPELIDKEINSPGEPGIAYHLGIGFTTSRIQGAASEFQIKMKKAASDRTRGIVEKVNPALAPCTLDFEKDVLPLTPAGNATERHVCAAYAAKAEKLFPDAVERAEFWAGKLGLTHEESSKLISDTVKLQGKIRSKMMKSGGPGYVKPEPSAFPALRDMNEFTLACGAIPSIAWLNGESAGESDPDALLDLHESCGAALFNLIPDRNWNFTDPDAKAKKTAAMDKIIAACEKRAMPVIVGTEMNAAGQKLVDTFAEPALAKHLKLFLDGAALTNAHTMLTLSGRGYASEWANSTFKDKRARNAFFTAFGKKFTLADAPRFTGACTEALLNLA